jgi:hypothetical protein
MTLVGGRDERLERTCRAEGVGEPRRLQREAPLRIDAEEFARELRWRRVRAIAGGCELEAAAVVGDERDGVTVVDKPHPARR